VPVMAQAEMTFTHGHPRLNWPEMAKVNIAIIYITWFNGVDYSIRGRNLLAVVCMTDDVGSRPFVCISHTHLLIHFLPHQL